MLSTLLIQPPVAAHWPAARASCEAGIATSQSTFTTEAPSWDTGHRPHCRLVAATAGGVAVAWAALAPVSSRCVCAGVAAVSSYIAAQGMGRQLLAAPVAASEQNGLWTLQASIFPENAASPALHANQGFRPVGWRQRIGQRCGHWHDTLLLECRSTVVGAALNALPA